MASFIKYIDMARNMRISVANGFLEPPGWLHGSILMGIQRTKAPKLKKRLMPPQLVMPSDIIMDAVIAAIPEFNGYEWSPLDETNKFYVPPVRRVAALTEKYIVDRGLEFDEAIEAAYDQFQDEQEDRVMQATLAKQDAEEAGVTEAGWDGFLERSTQLFEDAGKKRDAWAKHKRYEMFLAKCEEKVMYGIYEPLSVDEFDMLFDQEEMRQVFIEYPRYRHLFPKLWYLMPCLPERDGEVAWPPPGLIPVDEEHDAKLAVAVEGLKQEGTVVDQTRLAIMKEFYEVNNKIDESRRDLNTLVDFSLRDETTLPFDYKTLLQKWWDHEALCRKEINEHTQPPTFTERLRIEETQVNEQKSIPVSEGPQPLLAAVQDQNIFDPVYWSHHRNPFLTSNTKIEDLTPEQKKEYDLLKLKGRELAYEIEKDFLPRSPTFLQEHDELFGKDAEVPPLPPRMVFPTCEEDIMAFSPKYIREYFPEAFRLAVKRTKEQMAAYEKEANLAPTDIPHVGLWARLKQVEGQKKGVAYDPLTYRKPDWQSKINFDPTYYYQFRPPPSALSQQPVKLDLESDLDTEDDEEF